MDCIECVVCFNDISLNEHYTLACCKNDVHICCLNDWVQKNIAKTNISKCFICSQENDIIETMVSYNKSSNIKIITDYDYNNSTINHNIDRDIVIYNNTNSFDIENNTDNRLHFIFILTKVFFLSLSSTLLIILLYYIS